MERFLAKTTYRTILKHATTIDKDAALRAVLVSYPCSFYDLERLRWTSVDARQEWLASRRSVDDFVRELNGDAEWYLPKLTPTELPSPAIQTLKKAGKGKKGKPTHKLSSSPKAPPSLFAGEVASHVRGLYRSSPLTSQNINNAFSAVKMLSYVMQVQGQLPKGDLLLPDSRNLIGFEVLGSVAPVSHPHLIGEEVGRPVHSKSQAKTLAAAQKIVDEQNANKVTATQAPADIQIGKVTVEAAQRPKDLLAKAMAAAAGAKTEADEALPPPPAAPAPAPSQFGLQLIIAHPLMAGFFRHSIVMLNHAGPSGALGFIINKPVVNDDGQLMPVWSFIPDVVHQIFTKYLPNNSVFIGGPVASPASRSHALFILHRFPNVSGSFELGEGIYSTNDFDSIYSLFEAGKAKPEQVMVLLGYCGWGDNQLEEEVRRGSWVVLKRPWDAKDPQGQEGYSTTADYVFSKNVVVESTTNLPRSSSEPLRVVGAKSGKRKDEPAEVRAPTAVGEPRLSWVSLFASLSPKHRSMARLADVRVDPFEELFEDKDQ